MARRNKEDPLGALFKMLVDLPWWFGPILAGLVYLFRRFILPLVGSYGAASNGNLVSHVLGGASIMLAPWASLLVLAVWVAAESRKFIGRKRLDAQTDLESIGRLSWLEFEELLAEYNCRQESGAEAASSCQRKGDPCLRFDVRNVAGG